METYFSQHGEDFLLDKIFKGKTDGYFVEVGSLDGIEFSNSYYFEKKGWKGCCIEAHQDFIPQLKKNRPGSSIVHCAVGECNQESVTFYANKLGSLSTLDKSQEERWKNNYKDYFYGFEEQKVEMRTLTNIFDELGISVIDFVSLDIEGYEVQALAGLDFNKYRPHLFIIEYKDDAHRRQIEEILFAQKYHYLSRIGCNLFYGVSPSHKKILTAPYGRVQLLQVEMGGRAIWHTADHLTPSISRKIKTRVKRSIVGKAWRHFSNLLHQYFNRLKIPSYKKKRAIIDTYRRKYNLKIFVETGTFLGDTIAFFKHSFERLFSIELSEELYHGARMRFEQDKNVTVLQGDSGIILQELVSKIDAPALYWLDGHYSSEFYIGDRYIKTAMGEKVTPVMKELEILLQDKHRHTILIDDARLFNGRWDYPKIDEVTKVVNNSPGGYTMSVNSDIIRIVPRMTKLPRLENLKQ